MRRSGFAVEHPWWPRVALVVALVLLGSTSPVSSASAGVVKEATNRVGSTVDSVEDTAAGAIPPLPKAPPPPAPPAPPAPPPPLAPPRATPKPPVTPPPPSSRSDPSADAPSTDGTAAAAGRSTGAPGGLGGEASSRVGPTRSEGGVSGSVPSERSAAAGKARPGTAARTPLSVRPAEVAAAGHWIARVWPAIALDGGGAGQAPIVTTVGEALLRPAIAVATRSLQAVAGVARAVGYDDAPPAGSSPAPDAQRGSLPNVAAPADWEKIPYLVAMAAILALLAFAIWREFRSALPPYAR